MPDESQPDFGRIDPPNLGLIRERSQLLRKLRQFFDDLGFLEVQTPCLSRDCIVDAYIDPIEISAAQLGIGLKLPPRYYLQTSPEMAMKRMLAAGAPSIYSLGPVFRAGEFGDSHNPEFTMLEWYEVGADLNEGIRRLGSLATAMLDRDAYDVISYRQLFLGSLGFDPIDVALSELRARVGEVDPALVDSMGKDRDGMLDVLLSEYIQPKLGFDRPVIVKNYPLSQAALARRAEDDAQCAARFELFANGLELANGYDELRDQEVLSKRFRQTDARRIAAGRKPVARQNLAIENAISAGLPPCTGVALGVDRLLMVLAGKHAIGDVIPFTIDLA